MEQIWAGQKEKIKKYLPLYNRIITEFERSFCQISRILSDDEQGDGLIIESEGTSYARYSQYIPGAKELVEKHIQPDIKVEADSVNEDLSEETEMNMTM